LLKLKYVQNQIEIKINEEKEMRPSYFESMHKYNAIKYLKINFNFYVL